MGALAHELRNHLTTATLSFGILQSGKSAIAQHRRTPRAQLKGLNDLIERSLAEVRLERWCRKTRDFRLAEFVKQMGERRQHG